MRTSVIMVVLFAAFSIAGCAANSGGAAAPRLPKAITLQGDRLASADGMTLYVFDKDKAGQSVCNDDCAKVWLPVAAAAEAADNGDFTVVARKDGTRQWAYKGRPIYRFIKDKNVGDVKGDGVKGVWHIAVK